MITAECQPIKVRNSESSPSSFGATARAADRARERAFAFISRASVTALMISWRLDSSFEMGS